MKRAVLVVLAALSTAGSCGDKHTTPPAASTGAFGIVTIDGRQKLYLPQISGSNGSISVVDVGASGKGTAGAPALITAIDLGAGTYATATSGSSDVVVAASTDYPTVWFIDPRTDKVTGTLTLPSQGKSGFSGGGGYVTGIAIDEVNHRAILSVWNGFAIVDLNSRALTKTIEAPPSENFAFDATRQRIVAPFYQCGDSSGPANEVPSTCASMKDLNGNPMSDGLNVIDLADSTVYTFQNAAAQSPTAPVGDEPDAAAVDVSTGIAVVPSEGNSYQSVIDLSKAVFDKAKKSVTAPQRIVRPSQEYTGVSVEPGSHQAFFEEEGSDAVGLIQLSDANGGGGTFVESTMPLLPGGSSWGNMGDPHGIAVTTGVSDGRAYGFLVSRDRRWVGRVDLAKMAAGQLATGVTYLDASAKP